MRASLKDAEEILSLQKAAYLTEAALYDNYGIPPLKETVSEIEKEFGKQLFLKAVTVSDGRIIGTVRAYEEGTTCHIGRLAVLPEFRKHGVGTALMRAIEKESAAQRFELFTGSKSADNIRLYQKLGYAEFKTAEYGCGWIKIVYMEKLRN